MYYPYLRGKLFELETLLEVSGDVYKNTFPIIEPVNNNRTAVLRYKSLVQRKIPFIFIVNPRHPKVPFSIARIQQLFIEDILSDHTNLTLGYIVDQLSSTAELSAFLRANPDHPKAVIFKYTLTSADLAAYDTVLKAHTPEILLFDDRKISSRMLKTLNWHTNQVIITDGFQRQDRNADYPLMDAFDSYTSTWVEDGWQGMGDYLTIGDHFAEGGGQPYVVTFHITVPNGNDLEIYHYSSTTLSTVKGRVGPKFLEACNMLVSSPHTTPLSSTGLSNYRDWNSRSHTSVLGAAKKASMKHHIEMVSSII